MVTWSIEILQCGSGPPCNFLSKILGVNTPLFLHHTVLLLVFFNFSLSHDQACIHMSSMAAQLQSVYPWSWLSSFQCHCFLLFLLSFVCVFVLFFIANHVCNGIVWKVDIMLPISVTHVYHNCLRSTSPVIYDICSYVAHVLSSFSSLTTVFLAAFLSIINLPNLTMNTFIDACCGWTGKLTVIFSNTAKPHMHEIQTEKHVI